MQFDEDAKKFIPAKEKLNYLIDILRKINTYIDKTKYCAKIRSRKRTN
jgi:hypothetical protein